MADENYKPSKLEMLAALVTGNASYRHIMASVQRSHRFPLHLFSQIENMAQMGGIPASVVINELLECGLEALKRELSPDELKQVTIMSNEQVRRPTVTDRVDAKGRNVGGKRKLKRSK